MTLSSISNSYGIGTRTIYDLVGLTYFVEQPIYSGDLLNEKLTQFHGIDDNPGTATTSLTAELSVYLTVWY